MLIGISWKISLIFSILLSSFISFNIMRIFIFREHKKEFKKSVAKGSDYISFMLETAEDMEDSGEKYTLIDYIDGNSAIIFQLKYGMNSSKMTKRNITFMENLHKQVYQDNLMIKTNTTYENLKDTEGYIKLLNNLQIQSKGMKKIFEMYAKIIKNKIENESRVLTEYITITTQYSGQRSLLENYPKYIKRESDIGTSYREIKFLNSDDIKNYTKDFLGVNIIDFTLAGGLDSNKLEKSIRVHSYITKNNKRVIVNSIESKYKKKYNTEIKSEKVVHINSEVSKVLADIEGIFGEGAIDL